MGRSQIHRGELDYFRLDDSDLEALAGLRSAIEASADRLVGEFYQHLLRFPETQHLLRDRAVRDRLLEKQREYLLSLTDPTIDEAYIESRVRIGEAHVRIGLDTQWYLGAYALYLDLLTPLIQTAAGPDPVSVERAHSAICRRLMFDAEIAIRQYIDRREQELQRLNEELQTAGKALTREVDQTHRDLRRSEARAAAAEQLASVATLVTGLAHEIGTPMGVIRGHAESLESAVHGERAEWRLRMILEQIDRITSIIQSLLNIARPKRQLRKSLDLAECVDSSLAFLTEKFRRKGVQIERSYADVPDVVGDPEKLQQIFLNLFLNAVDAMPEGGTLRVGLASQEPDLVRVVVSDTGTGIPTEDLGTIFDPCYTTKAAGNGNGLGLVVVKNIVREHGGQIEARSELGRGAEFEIQLPAAASGPSGGGSSRAAK